MIKISSPLNNQKGVVLLLSFIIMITLTTIAFSYVSLVTFNTKNVSSQTSSKQALYLAMAGLNKAVYYLKNTAPDSSTDGSWRTTAYPAASGAGTTDPRQENLGEGTYTMWVEGSAGSTSSSTPVAFGYTLFSGGNINFRKSNDTTIIGNVAATTNLNDADDVTITGTQTENSTVIFPTVDMAIYKGLATTGQDISGNKTFSAGTYSGIWYIDGLVTIESNVTINGTVIATNNIQITKKAKNVTITPTGNYPALVGEGEIQMEEQTNLTINGLVYATGRIQPKKGDGITINGSIISGGNIEMTDEDDVTITYDSDLASSPPTGFSQITTTAASIQITARGTVDSVVRIIRQNVNLGAFSYAIHAAKNVDFKSSSGGTITGDVGSAANVKNADDITIAGVSNSTTGIITPTVTMASYKAIASTGQDISGNKTFSSGTHSGIWYIDGVVDFDDNVTINGSIIATGKMNAKKTTDFTITPTSNYPAMVSEGEINLEEMDNSTFNGLIYSLNKIKLKKCTDCTFNGSLISGNTVELKETDDLSIIYDSTLYSDPPPYFANGTARSVPNSWTECPSNLTSCD